MGTNYPNSIDAFINPTPEDDLNSTTVPHDQQHANANDAIEAIETILGINPTGSFSTVKDRRAAIEQALGTMSSQNSNNVNITGGSIVGLSIFDNITINGGTF
jgi:hypothetical protein